MRLYSFKDVIGNYSTIKLLQGALIRTSLPNFIILSGIPGTGKSTCAEITGLYLTCENPNNGEPCLTCSSCKKNIKALQADGMSSNLEKINLGLKNTKGDVEQLIKEVFRLENLNGNNVYILEEAHSLSKQEQTALLEEIDRVSPNTYIIVCTTKLYSLLPELRSRAITFNFNRLNKQDTRLLIDRTCNKLGIKQISPRVATMLMDYCRGVPRDIINLINFISSSSASEDDVRKFLGHIDSSVFSTLFESMTGTMSAYHTVLDSVLATYTYDVVIEQLRDYFLSVVYFLEGNIKEGLSKYDIEVCKRLFNDSNIYKISAILEKLNPQVSTEEDLQFSLLKIRQLVKGKTLVDIVREDKEIASESNANAQENFKELQSTKELSTGGLKPLDLSTFMKVTENESKDS